MPFRPVFIAIVIAFALILGAFLIQRARPRVELDQPNANFVRATGVLHAGVAFHAFTCFSVVKQQLKSLLRLSRTQDIRILVPMVTLDRDMQKMRELFLAAAHELGIETLPPLGAMIETPAAALTVGQIAKHADFLSVGTNDLTQYTLVARRDNATVRDYYEDTHPSMFRLLGIIIAVEAGLDLRRARGSRGSHPNANGNRLPCAQYFPSADLDNERANQIDWHQKTCEATLIKDSGTASIWATLWATLAFSVSSKIAIFLFRINVVRPPRIELGLRVPETL